MQGTWGRSGVRLRLTEGETIRTQEEIDEFLKKKPFKGYFYNILNQNCIIFANLFVKFLRGKDITAEKFQIKVNTFINAIPVNYLIHRAVASSSTSRSLIKTKTESNSDPNEESNSSEQSKPKQKSNPNKKSYKETPKST